MLDFTLSRHHFEKFIRIRIRELLFRPVQHNNIFLPKHKNARTLYFNLNAEIKLKLTRSTVYDYAKNFPFVLNQNKYQLYFASFYLCFKTSSTTATTKPFTFKVGKQFEQSHLHQTFYAIYIPFTRLKVGHFYLVEVP